MDIHIADEDVREITPTVPLLSACENSSDRPKVVFEIHLHPRGLWSSVWGKTMLLRGCLDYASSAAEKLAMEFTVQLLSPFF